MPYSICGTKKACLLLGVLLSTNVQGHPGQTDSYGCHNDTATGTYHCHSGPLTGQSFISKDAMLRALARLPAQTPAVPTNPTAPTDPTSHVAVSPQYDRAFYKHWIDADSDCMNTRHEVLAIESLIPVTLSSNGCSVIAGRWYDPFTGNTYTNPSDLDIDHMVPLEETHNSGGFAWDSSRRQSYANDMVLAKSLIAVSASANRSKGSRDPAGWLPANIDYRCDYVKDWTEVKLRRGLMIDHAEAVAIKSVLNADIALASRRESTGWDEIAGKHSPAVFGLGVRRVNECAYTRSPLSTDNIEITVSVLPDAAHINQEFLVFLVAEMYGGLYSLNARGEFTLWDGDLGNLIPFSDSIYVQESFEFPVFTGILNEAMDLNVYVGYGTESGDFVYTGNPIAFNVVPRSQN